MTITCPSCEASYRIDAGTLGEGRKVRCARCRAEWFAAADPRPAADQIDPPPALERIPGLDDAHSIDAVDSGDFVSSDEPRDAEILPPAPRPAGGRWRPGRSPKSSRRPGLRPAGDRKALRLLSGVRPVAAVAALAVAACGLLVGERDMVVRAAPSLASLYASVGLPVNVRGLAIGDLRSVEEIDEGVPLLLVTGSVRNVSGGPLDVPRLRLAVTGGGDRELYAWTTVAARAKLAAGESAPFRARLASPPADGQGIAVRFLARKDLMASAGR